MNVNIFKDKINIVNKKNAHEIINLSIKSLKVVLVLFLDIQNCNGIVWGK